MQTQVTVNIFRGPRPTLAILNQLHQIGCKSILNLEESLFGFQTYGKPVLDFVEYNVPLSQQLTCPPNPDQVNQCLSILLDEKTFPIYVHCKEGVDRTGFIIACYNVFIRKWTPDEAIKDMFNQGYHKWRYLMWTTVLMNMLNTHEYHQES